MPPESNGTGRRGPVVGAEMSHVDAETWKNPEGQVGTLGSGPDLTGNVLSDLIQLRTFLWTSMYDCIK